VEESAMTTNGTVRALMRTEEEWNPLSPGALESAKKAISDMKDRASDGLGVAKHRLFGDGPDNQQVAPELCHSSRDIAFARATTIYSNLGGLGPDVNSPQSLRFANVFPDSGSHVDMIVTATSKYVGTPMGKNSIMDDFLVINVNSGSSVKVRFSFVDRLTGAPIEVPTFLLTVAGFGHQADGGAKQSITTGDHKDVYTWSNGSKVLVDSTAQWNTTFTSMSPENATLTKSLRKARNMMPGHLEKAITLKMPHMSHFEMLLAVKPGIGSRDFFFSGASNMVCDAQVSCATFTCPTFFAPMEKPHSILCKGNKCTEDDIPTCCTPVTPEDCHPAHTLTIKEKMLQHSNLGGQGPDFTKPKNIRFGNVFPNAYKPLDLEVSTLNAYTPANVSLNGVHKGKFGSVNVAPGTSLDLLFSFYEPGTNRLSPPGHRFFLTFHAFDKVAGVGIEQVRIHNTLIKGMSMVDEHAVHISTDNLNRTVFVPNENHPRDATPEISVLIGIEAQFLVTISAPVGAVSQSFRFSGYSASACPPLLSLCERATCPGGHMKRMDAVDRRCAGETCTIEDTGICCEPVLDDVCDAKNYMQLPPDSLVESNLGGLGPNTDSPEHIFFTDIFPDIGHVVNMRITAIGKYAMASTPHNGLSNEFIKIDVEPGMTVHLKFEFLDEVVGNALSVPMLYFTVADIDKGAGEFCIESVGLTGNSWVNITEGSSLVPMEKSHGGNSWSFFEASAFGDERVSPFDAVHKKVDAKKSLGALFKSVSEIELVLSVSQADKNMPRSMHPRSFYIGGQTSLACPVPRASCATHVCPAKETLRTTAGALYCAGPECTADDSQTCCHASNEDECDSTRAMVIAPHSLVHSNFCGLGPDEGEASLIFGNVFPGSGKHIDLEITGTGCAIFDESRNGITGSIGTISMQAGAVMGMDFKLVHSNSRELVTDIWQYVVTFLNMDTPLEDASSYVEIAVSNLKAYQVTDRTTIRVSNNTFRSGGHSKLSDHPWHPHALMPRHLARSVSLKFDTPTFNVLASVSKGFTGGHDLMFAGSSNLACPVLAFCSTAQCPSGYQHRPTANSTTCLGATCTDLDATTCCMRSQCTEERSLQIRRVRYSNLGTAGPDTNRPAAIVYADVFPMSGQEVDLEVTAVGKYWKPQELLNGLEGPFGIISMAPGTDITLKFRFVEPGTHTLASVDSFLFSVFNMSLPNDNMGKMVSVTPFDLYELTKSTKLYVESRNGKTFVTSNPDPAGWRLQNPPDHPLALGQTQMNHTITYVMPANSEFTVTVSVAAGWVGQNILFAGPSSVMCEPQALCSSLQCPAKMKLRHDAFRVVCKERKCNHVDTDHCCVPKDVKTSTDSELSNDARGPRRSAWAIDEDVLA